MHFKFWENVAKKLCRFTLPPANSMEVSANIPRKHFNQCWSIVVFLQYLWYWVLAWPNFWFYIVVKTGTGGQDWLECVLKLFVRFYFFTFCLFFCCKSVELSQLWPTAFPMPPKAFKIMGQLRSPPTAFAFPGPSFAFRLNLLVRAHPPPLFFRGASS